MYGLATYHSCLVCIKPSFIKYVRAEY